MRQFLPYNDTLLTPMKVSIIFAAVCLLMLGTNSCDFTDRTTEIAFGQEFRVEYDQTVRLEDGTELRFLELKKDTRCPEDALCPYEGEAVIALVLEDDDRPGSVVELKIPGLADRHSRDRHKPEQFWEYRLTLLQLDPYPLTDHIERRFRYVATLLVEKKEGEDPG